jgi:hypothetical protein
MVLNIWLRDDRPTLTLAASAPGLRDNQLVFPLTNATEHPALNAHLTVGVLKSLVQTVAPKATVEFELAVPNAHMSRGVEIVAHYQDTEDIDWTTIFTVTISGGRITATTRVG